MGASEPSPATSRAWAAAEQAAGAIRAGQGTLNTLSDLIRALASVGLGSVIEPVLASVNLPGAAWESQRAGILEEARKLSGSKLAWETFGQVFKDNLASLTSDNPSLAGLADLWGDQQGRYELHRAADGNFQIIDKNAASIFAGLLGGLTDHRALTKQWTYQRNGFQAIRPIAFDGAGYGWLLLRVLESTHETFLNYSCAVYVLEPGAASVCMLLHLHDLQRWGRRLRFFVGQDAVQQFRRGLSERNHWMPPVAVICDRLQPRPALDIQPTLAAVAEERRRRDESLRAEMGAYYENLTPAYWSARYAAALAGGKPLKVLGITSRFTTVLQYSMDELGAAIGAAGHEFILAKETDDQSLDQPELELIARHKPDLLVLISRMRHENPQLPKNVPFLCWDQDNLPCMRTTEAARSLDALTFVAGAGAWSGYQDLNWPRRNCILVSQAASAHRYSNEPVAEALLRKHRCTFSYTSNAAGTPQSLIGELRGKYEANPRLLAIFDGAAAEVVRRSNAGFVWDALPLVKMLDELVQSQSGPLEAPVRQEVLLDLRRVSDRAFRHVALGWVVDYCKQKNTTLRLYGNGWESSPVFGPYAAGFLAPGEELRAVYQASDINLQLIEMGFQHSRALDGLAAGGFFLYRAGAELREFDRSAESILAMTRRAQETGCLTFGQLDASTDPVIAEGWAYARTVISRGKPGDVCEKLDRWHPAGIDNEVMPHLNEIMFGSREQFVAMAEQYLGDPERRRSVAAKLRRVVVERFSYDARWRQFLRGISEGLASAAGKPADKALHRAA